MARNKNRTRQPSSRRAAQKTRPEPAMDMDRPALRDTPGDMPRRRKRRFGHN